MSSRGARQPLGALLQDLQSSLAAAINADSSQQSQTGPVISRLRTVLLALLENCIVSKQGAHDRFMCCQLCLAVRAWCGMQSQ